MTPEAIIDALEKTAQEAKDLADRIRQRRAGGYSTAGNALTESEVAHAKAIGEHLTPVMMEVMPPPLAPPQVQSTTAPPAPGNTTTTPPPVTT